MMRRLFGALFLLAAASAAAPAQTTLSGPVQFGTVFSVSSAGVVSIAAGGLSNAMLANPGLTLGTTALTLGATTTTLSGLTLSGPTLSGTTTLPGGGAITSGGQLGLGTTSPVDLLQVTEDVDIGANYPSDTGYAQLLISGATNPNQRLALGYDTTNNLGVIQAAIAGTNVEPLAIQPKGGAAVFGGPVNIAAATGGSPSKYVCADGSGNLVLSSSAC